MESKFFLLRKKNWTFTKHNLHTSKEWSANQYLTILSLKNSTQKTDAFFLDDCRLLQCTCTYIHTYIHTTNTSQQREMLRYACFASHLRQNTPLSREYRVFILSKELAQPNGSLYICIRSRSRQSLTDHRRQHYMDTWLPTCTICPPLTQTEGRNSASETERRGVNEETAVQSRIHSNNRLQHGPIDFSKV